MNQPPVYTREDIPLDIEEVASRENIKSCDHFKVIGVDCAKPLKPLEVIPSKNVGPFAFRTIG